MRKTFIDTLTQLARQDKDIMLLTGDLGFSVFEDFAKEFPNRFINCGVMEQSMISIAAGLALDGKKPYVYSIIPFATMRPFEQIRNDVCYQNLNVKIIGIGAGFLYGAFGSTHHAIEDIAILRPLPNLTILSPADANETKALVLQSYQKSGPTYIRMVKAEKNLAPTHIKTIISKPSIIQTGKDGVLIATGTCVEMGLDIVATLKENGIHLTLISLHTLKPVDEKSLTHTLKKHNRVFTLEEHRMAGGLGSLVAEIMMRHNLGKITLENFGINDNYHVLTGHQEHLAAFYSIDMKSIFKKIIKHYKYGK